MTNADYDWWWWWGTDLKQQTVAVAALNGERSLESYTTTAVMSSVKE